MIFILKIQMLNISEQEKRRILTLHMLAEQEYTQINIGGKILTLSTISSNIYNAILNGDKDGIYKAIQNNIKNVQDLNLVFDEFTYKIKKDFVSLLDNIFKSNWSKGRENSKVIMDTIKKYLAPIANVTWDEGQAGQYDGGLKITSKNPNLKHDTRSVEQKRDDDIANKEKMRQYVNSMYCTVKNGVIVNPASQWNNRPWSEFVSTVKVTAEQLASAKAACPNGELSKSQQPAQTQWTKETFPLRFMMKGPNVGKLQQALGIKPTNQFYTKTEAKVNSKMKELGLTYNRATGIDQTTFNKIIAAKGSTPQDIAGQTVKNWAQNLQKTDNLPTPEEFEKQQQPTTQKTQLTPQELAKAQAIAKQYGNEPLKGI
jgi:hypothetical protein